MRNYVRAAVVMGACTAIGTLLMGVLSLTDIAMLHLIGVGIVAAWGATRRQAAFAALLSVALFDFFFVPPRFTFTVSDLHYIVTFGVMLVTALVISWLAERVREDAVAARTRERGTGAMLPMTAELLGAKTVGDVVAVVGRQVRAAFGADVRVLLRESGGRLTPVDGAPADSEDRDRDVAQWAFQKWEAAGAGTTHFPDAHNVYLPLVGSRGRLGVLELHPDDPSRLAEPAVRWLLLTFAAQAALAIERVLPGGRPAASMSGEPSAG